MDTGKCVNETENTNTENWLTKIKAIEDKFNEIKKDIRNLNLSSENDDSFEDYGTLLSEAKEDLYAKRYFICVLGSVKTGKSTLINALCQRSDKSVICIDGAGKETTKLPSIIKSVSKKEDEGIYFYQFKNPLLDGLSDEQKKSALHAQKKSLSELLSAMIIDKDCTKINGISRSTKYPLNEDELKHLTTDTDVGIIQDCPNAFLAEINYYSTDTLSCKDEKTPVAIIDMPGLDGIIAGKAVNPIIELIAERCPRLFLVQSSMSTINATGLETFKKLKVKHSNVCVTVIFNKVEAIGWYSPAEQEKYFNTLSVHVRNDLDTHGIGCDNFISVNLFKAKDSLTPKDKWNNKDKDKEQAILRKESNIDELINHIKGLDPDDMKIIRAKDSIKRLYTNFDEHFDGLKKKLNDQKKEFTDKSDAIEEKIKKLKGEIEKEKEKNIISDLENNLKEVFGSFKWPEPDLIDSKTASPKDLRDKTKNELIRQSNKLSMENEYKKEDLRKCFEEALKTTLTNNLKDFDTEDIKLLEDTKKKVKNMVQKRIDKVTKVENYLKKLPNDLQLFLDQRPFHDEKYTLEYFNDFISDYPKTVKSDIMSTDDEREKDMLDAYQSMCNDIINDLKAKEEECADKKEKYNSIIERIDKELKEPARILKQEIDY